MPRALVNQLSADLNGYIRFDEMEEKVEVWNNAVNLEYEGSTQCQVKEDFLRRRITICASGKDARGLMILAMNSLNSIIMAYRGVEYEIQVPCTCSKCEAIRGSEANPGNDNFAGPYRGGKRANYMVKASTFNYNFITSIYQEGREVVTCNVSGQTIPIDDLLYNVGVSLPAYKTMPGERGAVQYNAEDVAPKYMREYANGHRFENAQGHWFEYAHGHRNGYSREHKHEYAQGHMLEYAGKLPARIIKIFLASSRELAVDRNEFEIFINRENKKMIEQNTFLHLEIWEDFIDAMSSSRLQDEYNKAVEGADIFVSLFFTKAGKYTEEEFETAYKKFIENGKPLVYTYFKNSNINTSDINRGDINSLLRFKDKLKELGHFPTEYENADQLKNHFRNQLDKLLTEA